MKRHHLVLVLVLAAMALATTALAAMPRLESGAAHLAAQQPGPTLPQDHVDDVVCGGLDAPNLLQNPSFEGPYSAYVPPGGHDDCPTGTCGTAQMADGWTPYWRSHDPGDPDEIIRMPEYKPAESGQDPPRTHDGDRAQQYFSFSSTHEAGFYQQVSVTPGQVYCFGIWGHSWSSSIDDPFSNDSEIEQNVGIDPTGGTNWQSSDIIWGGPKQYYYEFGEGNPYGPFSLAVRAEAPHITVFTWSRPVWPVRHNDVYWDDAILLAAPEEPAMSLSRHGIAIVEQTADAGLYNLLFDISFAQDPGVIWRATVEPGNTLDVEIWPMVPGGAAGRGEDDLRVTFATDAYTPGSYNATITVESDPAVAGSPATVNVSLHIFEEIHEQFLPLYTN